jgi:DNA invertase Pin-like site-specific DNA recombinase
VHGFLQGRGELVASFTEVESGKRNDRPEITTALAACRKHKAVLVIAKLDRLARNVHFISGLMGVILQRYEMRHQVFEKDASNSNR